jgi:hypothetical protein
LVWDRSEAEIATIPIIDRSGGGIRHDPTGD